MISIHVKHRLFQRPFSHSNSFNREFIAPMLFKLLFHVFMVLITIKIIRFRELFALHIQIFINTRIFYVLDLRIGSKNHEKAHLFFLFVFFHGNARQKRLFVNPLTLLRHATFANFLWHVNLLLIDIHF